MKSSLLGLSTSADAANPYLAKLNAALWTALSAAEGGAGDLRYVMNKETAAGTLSLLIRPAGPAAPNSASPATTVFGSR